MSHQWCDTHAAPKLDTSDASLTHSFIPNIRFYGIGFLSVRLERERWEESGRDYGETDNQPPLKSFQSSICKTLQARLWGRCPSMESPSFACIFPLDLLSLLRSARPSLVRPVLFLPWATGTAWLPFVSHTSAWVRATSLPFWGPWSPQTLEPICWSFTPTSTTF